MIHTASSQPALFESPSVYPHRPAGTLSSGTTPFQRSRHHLTVTSARLLLPVNTGWAS